MGNIRAKVFFIECSDKVYSDLCIYVYDYQANKICELDCVFSICS